MWRGAVDERWERAVVQMPARGTGAAPRRGGAFGLLEQEVGVLIIVLAHRVGK